MKRALSKDAVVIADGLNYIKGYRYQLWCEAKAAGTRCCVVHVAAREDECKIWNKERLRKQGKGTEEYDEEAERGDGHTKQQDYEKPAVFGDLVPESHTALYGDRGSYQPASRSSSIDVELEDKPPAPSLKSLSLRDPATEAPSLISLSLNDAPNTQTIPVSNVDSSSQKSTRPDLPKPTPQDLPIFPPYSSATLHSLIFRYEPPSPFSRWDTPLFTLPSNDQHPPYDQIWTALFPSTASARKISARNGDTADQSTRSDVVKPHAATVLPPSTSASALQTLERTTAEIVTSLFAAYKGQNIGDGGGEVDITLPDEQSESQIELNIEIPPGTMLTQPMLQRLRRKYTQIQRGGIAHGQGYVSGRRAVVEGFGRFLEGEFGS